jgi:hypothetical protein
MSYPPSRSHRHLHPLRPRPVSRLCATVTAADRPVCSERCADALTRTDLAIQLILKKSLQSARASSYYYLFSGVFCAAGTVGEIYWAPIPFLEWFTGGCSALFLVTGTWYFFLTRKQNP